MKSCCNCSHKGVCELERNIDRLLHDDAFWFQRTPDAVQSVREAIAGHCQWYSEKPEQT